MPTIRKITPLTEPETPQPQPVSSPMGLLDGWRRVRFGEMANSITDRVDDPAEAGVEYYVGLEHLDPDSLKIRRWGQPTDVEATKLRFKPGDIIFGRRRAYQRKLAVAEFEGICSAHALVLRPRKEVVLPEFLPFFMQSDIFFDRAMSISVGSLSPTINWKTLAQQEFNLPPYDEQRRVAEILWAADNTIDKLNAALKECDYLRKRYLRYSVLGEGVEAEQKETEVGLLPEHWRVEKIKHAGLVQMGRQRAPQYQTGAFSRPYLRVANVFDDHIDINDVLEMDFDEVDFQRFVLMPGDILLNEGQSRELVGRSAIFRGEISGCCFQNTLIRFRASAALLPEYAHAYFQLAFYQGTFASIARQTTSIAHLGADRFSELYMPIPPLSEQEHIVKTLNDINTSKQHIRTQLNNIVQLKKSLTAQMLGE